MELLAQGLAKKGVPPILNFEPAEYHYQGKIWDIDSSPSGLVYMASDKSLIEYDGHNWKKYEGSDGVIRSILVQNDSLIYTGSDLDFGVWKRDKLQNFEYKSLYPFQEDLKAINEEFWGIHAVGEDLFFVSASNIYIYTSQGLTKIALTEQIIDSFELNEALYFYCKNGSLYTLDNLAPKEFLSVKEPTDMEIVGLINGEKENELIIVTKNSGLFVSKNGNLKPLVNKLSIQLIESQVFSFEPLSNEALAFGTINSGLLIAQKDGQIIQSIKKTKGLLNNTILSIHQQPNKKLWLSMDYGVATVLLNSEFTFLSDQDGIFGTPFTAILDGNDFYIGTNQGLYVTAWDQFNYETNSTSFSLIKNSEGQVWTLSKINDQILVGHDKGLFILNNKSLEAIDNQKKGYWDVLQYENYLLGGTYNGVSIFKNENGKWRYLKQMDLIIGSSNQLLLDDEGYFWVNIPNYGLIRSKLDSLLNPVNRKIYLDDQFTGSDLYLINEQANLVLLSTDYSYEFDETSEAFASPKPLMYTDISSKFLFPNKKAIHLDNEYEFKATYNGFSLKKIDSSSYEPLESVNISVRKIEAFTQDSTIHVLNGEAIAPQFNNVRIHSVVANEDDVYYQYKLGEESAWSGWVKSTSITFYNLDFRKYSISLRAKLGEKITQPKTIQFEIISPWYLSWVAYIIYLILAALIGYVAIMRARRIVEKHKKQILTTELQNIKQKERNERFNLQFREVELLKSELNELKSQVKTKAVELASKTKENEEQKQLIQELKEKIQELKNHPELSNSRIIEIENILDQSPNHDSKTFELQMVELNHDFYKKLKESHSDLTSNDLKLSVYIKAGFDSKEIANLLNIKPSSVYISRSRLRKKLNLSSNDDLQSYLNSI